MFKKITALLMVIALSAGVGYAAGNGKSITVYYDTIKKIMIENQDKTPSDVKPFIYQGTTYVPLRYIAEQLGKPVYYDAGAQTIYIGARAKVVSVEKKDLFTLPTSGIFNPSVSRLNNSDKPYDNQDLDALWNYPAYYEMTYRIANTGAITDFETKTNGLSTKIYNGETVYYYNLGQGYDVLSGTVGYDGRLNPKIYDCTVNIIVDDVVRQEIKLDSLHPKESINANLTGGKTLKIQLKVDQPSGAVNVLKEPFLNLTDMTIEKVIYQ